MFHHQLRNEMWKLFAKKRTYIGFAMFLLAQNVISVVFRFSRASRDMVRTLEGNGYATGDYIWQLLFAKQIPWWKIGQSLSILFGFNVTFFTVGWVAFHVRDIKS